jgi:hypothetical protein
MKRPVQAQEAYIRKNRCASQECDAERNEVAKLMAPVARKAAIVYCKPVP